MKSQTARREAARVLGGRLGSHQPAREEEEEEEEQKQGASAASPRRAARQQPVFTKKPAG